MNSAFSGTILEISESVQNEMRGRSWHAIEAGGSTRGQSADACPPFSELRLLKLMHHGFDATIREGELVVHRDIAEEVVAIFKRLFALGFAIERMERVDRFEGSDAASMAANNSSAFNFRRVEGSSVLSHHARGLAIDLNPVQNPWVRGERVDPESGRDYLSRSPVRLGMIVEPGPVVDTFLAHGWHWGGHFDDMLDYHHFSKLPR